MMGRVPIFSAKTGVRQAALPVLADPARILVDRVWTLPNKVRMVVIVALQ